MSLSLGLQSEIQDRKTLSVSKAVVGRGDNTNCKVFIMEALRIEGFMPFLQGGIILKSMSHLKSKPPNLCGWFPFCLLATL